MRLPVGLKWLCVHRWRQTSTPRYIVPFHNEWVCLNCKKRVIRNITQPPIIYLFPWENGDLAYKVELPL